MKSGSFSHNYNVTAALKHNRFERLLSGEQPSFSNPESLTQTCHRVERLPKAALTRNDKKPAWQNADVELPWPRSDYVIRHAVRIVWKQINLGEVRRFQRLTVLQEIRATLGNTVGNLLRAVPTQHFLLVLMDSYAGLIDREQLSSSFQNPRDFRDQHPDIACVVNRAT